MYLVEGGGARESTEWARQWGVVTRRPGGRGENQYTCTRNHVLDGRSKPKTVAESSWLPPLSSSFVVQMQ